MSVGSTLKGYLWWTHERGSVPYDVMVTLILAFIFLTPRFFNYGDQPKPDIPPNEIRVTASATGGVIYIVPAEMAPSARGVPPSTEELADAIARVAGPVTVDRMAPVHEIGGRLVAWKVWAHR